MAFCHASKGGINIFSEDLFIKTVNISAVTGGEYKAAEMIAKLFRDEGAETHVDAFGNVIACIKATAAHSEKTADSEGSKSLRLIIDAHIDEIGMMVSGYEDGGFLRIADVAGVDPKTLPSAVVDVFATGISSESGDPVPLTGVIGSKPPHLLSEAEKNKALAIDKLYVDMGMDDETLRSKVKIGDYVTCRFYYDKLANGRAAAKTFDDRMGIYIMLITARELKKRLHETDVYFVCSVREEKENLGPMAAGAAIEPDAIIAVDVTHGSMPRCDIEACIGKGPVITLGPPIHPGLVELLSTAANEFGIPVQKELEVSYTGTNKDSYDKLRTGAPSCCLSVPLRYMHTQTELIDTGDLYTTARLLTELACRASGELEEKLCY